MWNDLNKHNVFKWKNHALTRRLLKHSTNWCPKHHSDSVNRPSISDEPSAFVMSAYCLTLARAVPFPFSMTHLLYMFRPLFAYSFKMKLSIFSLDKSYLCDINRSRNRCRQVYNLMPIAQFIGHVLNMIKNRNRNDVYRIKQFFYYLEILQ